MSVVAAVGPELAASWYAGWLKAWNSHDPERVRLLVTKDFRLTTPTSAVMG